MENGAALVASATPEILRLPALEATRDALAAYGTFLGADVIPDGLPIPFYRGTVTEGRSLPFVCPAEPVVRTARVHERAPEVIWIERHLRMTQLFVGLCGKPFAMVLGAPTHPAPIPDVGTVKLFVFPPGHGVLLHAGTWHDFPMTLPGAGPVTVLTVSSAEIVGALASLGAPIAIDRGDVRKVEVATALGVRLVGELPAAP